MHLVVSEAAIADESKMHSVSAKNELCVGQAQLVEAVGNQCLMVWVIQTIPCQRSRP
jgi:hypothetical protein